MTCCHLPSNLLQGQLPPLALKPKWTLYQGHCQDFLYTAYGCSRQVATSEVKNVANVEMAISSNG